jgi:hypothetical protein
MKIELDQSKRKEIDPPFIGKMQNNWSLSWILENPYGEIISFSFSFRWQFGNFTFKV